MLCIVLRQDLMIGRRTNPAESGYTLVETMMAVLVIGILAAMAMFQIGAARPGMQGDGAMRAVIAELNAARELAVAQRRSVQVVFAGSNQLQIVRIESPAGSGTTELRNITFESGVRYSVIRDIADTPDGFGNASATDFGETQTIRFDTDGCLVDAAGTPVNGTVFLAIPGFTQSYRAVTVLGTTGRVRGYRWTGSQWSRV
jgi:prepilin-type N-terminal cleavage/methylation domain-containing protein